VDGLDDGIVPYTVGNWLVEAPQTATWELCRSFQGLFL
jgi:hypothetical protein